MANAHNLQGTGIKFGLEKSSIQLWRGEEIYHGRAVKVYNPKKVHRLPSLAHIPIVNTSYPFKTFHNLKPRTLDTHRKFRKKKK